MCNFQPKHSQAGFTIIEVMIVVVVMGILSAFAVNSFYQQAFRQAVKGEGKQIQQFLNSANMYVKKIQSPASIQVNSTGMNLFDSAGCVGNQVRSNEWDKGIELTPLANFELTGLPSLIVGKNAAGLAGAWTSCIELTPQVGNTLTDNGAIIIGNSRLPSDEAYLIAVVKTTNNIRFLRYASIVGGDWELRK